MTSSEIKNQQAFPDEAQYGMTYHQWLVGKIAAGIVGNPGLSTTSTDYIAQTACDIADEICKCLAGETFAAEVRKRLEGGTPE